MWCFILIAGGDGSRSQADGEADFIIFDPRYGVLVIEVKDGNISYEGGRWYSTTRDTHEKNEIEPFRQSVSIRYISNKPE